MCTRCGEVIGVYEPMVVLEGEVARRTSLAAEPDLRRSARVRECVHAECAELDDSV
jgi:hypothetical protein